MSLLSGSGAVAHIRGEVRSRLQNFSGGGFMYRVAVTRGVPMSDFLVALGVAFGSTLAVKRP